MTKVLIADEDVLMHKALTQIINQMEGFQVIATLTSGEELVAYARENHPEIIFMDVKLYEMNGLHAAKLIKTELPETDICIISAYQHLSFVKEALKLEIKEYLTKPISAKSIRNILKEYNTVSCDYHLILEHLKEVVDAKEYRLVYERPKQIVSEIFELTNYDKDKIAEIMLAIEKDLQGMYLENPFEQKRMTEQFPMNQNLLDDPMVLEMRITRLLDYIYKQRFMERYVSVKPVFEYIDEHIKEYISMLSIIDNCHISQQYVLRLFKDQMKMSTLDYIQNRKMMLAKWYFYFGEYSTLDVAVMLGFGDAGYFSKIFKKFEHVTPHQFKADVKAENKKAMVI